MKKSALELIRPEDKGKRAVGAFNVFNPATVRGVFGAAEDAAVPVIFQLSQSLVTRYGVAYCVEMVEWASRSYSVEYAVHLDHGTDPDLIRKAIASGFTSVMFDGSAMPLEENITNTREISSHARQAGVTLEGEIGVIGGEEDGVENSTSALPTPQDVGRFAVESGVDMVAAAIGTRHGHYGDGKPRLDFELLARCAETIDRPLVLHGGTGLSIEQIGRCVSHGIQKINVSTLIKETYCATFTRAVESMGHDVMTIETECERGVKAAVSKMLAMISVVGGKERLNEFPCDQSWVEKRAGNRVRRKGTKTVPAHDARQHRHQE